MLENLVKKFNGVLLESKYVEPEYTIEEVITELNKVGIKVDASKEEGATIIDNTAYTWNISEEGTAKFFFIDTMNADEYKDAYEEITEFEDDDDDIEE